MTQPKFASLFACMTAALLIAAPAMGQLINFPVLALAPGGADGATSVGAGFGRGLNDDSGKQTSFGAGVARGMERVSFGVAGGYVATDTDELTLAGRVAGHLLTDGPAAVSIQAGLGWMSTTVATVDISTLNIPIGVAVQTNNDNPLRLWAMPRINLLRTSNGTSNTDTKFGASAGAQYALESGIGIGVAFDLQRADGGTADVSSVLISAGISYAIN